MNRKKEVYFQESGKSVKGLQYKKQGSLMIPIVMLLIFMTSATAVVMNIRKANVMQYQLLEDTYRMDVMLQLACLEIHNSLTEVTSEAECHLPSQLVFPQGEVTITYQQNKQACQLIVSLPNGHTKEGVYTIYLQETKE